MAQGVSRWVSRSDVFARQQSQGHRPLLCGILGALNNAQYTGKNLYDTLKQYVDPLTHVVADVLSPLAGTALGRQMAAAVYDARQWAQQHQSEIIAAATLVAAVGIVGVATAAVILTGGAAAIPMAILAGALIGGTAGAAGQLVQDLITGQQPRLENYLLPAAVGALGGAAAGLVVLGGGALGLSTVAIGAATGFSVGAISQYAINRLSGQPWHAGVGQMALAGGIGGAAGGLIASRFLSQNAGLATHMLVEGLSDALVSAGTQIGLNVAAGQAPLAGVGTAFAVGLTTGAVGGALGHFAEGWSQRRALAKWKEAGFDESGARGRWQDVTDAWREAGADLNDPSVRWMIERGRGPVLGASGGNRPIWDPFARRWRDPRTGRFARRPHDISEAFRAASRLVEGELSFDEVLGLLNTIAVASTRGDLTEGGVVSLGHFFAIGDAPGYIDWVKKNRSAAFFDMDPDVYATIKGKKIEGTGIPWLVNERFLDIAVEAGAIFHLQRRAPLDWDSGFGREIRYLEDKKGYEMVEEGDEWWLKR
jgi:hypothetical protein